MKKVFQRMLGKFFLLFVPLICSPSANSQEVDLLIKNGHVFDAKNNINSVMDVAVLDGKIFEIQKSLETDAKKTIDATGLYICPGLIDIHTHVFVGSDVGKFANGINSISPDDFTLKAGITTVVDAGTSGWQNFELFKAQVIDQSKTRILAFLNIAGSGMRGKPMEEDLSSMQPGKITKLIQKYPQVIVGVKIGHFENASWVPFDRAITACNAASVPLFVECHLPHYSLEDQLLRMRPGDIITHSFEAVSERETVIDEEGRVRPYILKARERGILFDVGHGGAGFWFSQAIPALEQGLWPNSFGTDMHRFSVNAGMKDMLNVMSKYYAMGMPLEEVFLRATWNPAQSIKREDLGNLDIGSVADIAILKLRQGDFGFVDAAGIRINGINKLEAEMTIRAGKILWDLNGLGALPYEKLR